MTTSQANGLANAAAVGLHGRVQNENTVVSFVAHNAARVEVHRHRCFQIVVSIAGSFACTIGPNSFSRKKGFIVNQNVTHSCQAAEASVIIHFIEAQSEHGRRLKALLAGEPFLDIKRVLSAAQLESVCAEGHRHLPKAELRRLADEIFEYVVPPEGRPRAARTDERVTRAMEFIDDHLHESVRWEDAAATMFLSPERARHLFAQTTGVPFSQYLLWKRIQRVIVTVLRDALSLGEAAVQSGFADQAHFCRIFKRTFGTSPKTHLKNSRFIQFLNPFLG